MYVAKLNSIHNMWYVFADEETVLTDKHLAIAAKELCISSSWIIFGAEIGLKNEVLDRIDIDTRGRRDSQQHAAYEMLCLARERKLLSTPSQLIRAILQSDKKTLAWKLSKLLDIPCSLTLQSRKD